MVDAERLDRFAAGYSVLAGFHLWPPDDATMASFLTMLDEWPLAGTAAAVLGLDALRESAAAGENAAGVRADHARLYGTLSRAVVSPYESVHRGEDRLVFDAHTLQVREAYQALSLQAPRLNQEPDDHIGLEFEFVAHTCLAALDALEAGAAPEVERCLSLGAGFLRDHLLRWAPDVLARVVDASQTRFMAGVAQLSLGALRSYAEFTGVAYPSES